MKYKANAKDCKSIQSMQQVSKVFDTIVLKSVYATLHKLVGLAVPPGANFNTRKIQ